MRVKADGFHCSSSLRWEFVAAAAASSTLSSALR